MNESVDIIMITLANGKREVHVIESGLAHKVEDELKTNFTNPNMSTIKSMPIEISRKLTGDDKEAKIVDHTSSKSFENPLNGLGNFGDMFGSDNPFDFFRKK